MIEITTEFREHYHPDYVAVRITARGLHPHVEACRYDLSISRTKFRGPHRILSGPKTLDLLAEEAAKKLCEAFSYEYVMSCGRKGIDTVDFTTDSWFWRKRNVPLRWGVRDIQANQMRVVAPPEWVGVEANRALNAAAAGAPVPPPAVEPVRGGAVFNVVFDEAGGYPPQELYFNDEPRPDEP